MTKRIYTILAMIMMVVAAQAQNALYITLSTGETAAVDLSTITELTFANNNLNVTVSGTANAIPQASIKEMTYGEMPTGVEVKYDGTSATVLNPYYFDGMSATISGAYVTLTNQNTSVERTVTLAGTTTDGNFTYNGSYKATFVLNGVNITSTKGAAIDIECGKRIAVELKKNTTNTLVDCANGDQKACFYCKGHLEFDKNGSLTITGKTAHALSAKEYIELKKSSGSITILGAVKDGIHCKQYFLGKGMSLNISGVGDDALQAEADGEANDEGYTDGSANIVGGTMTITTTADGAKGIHADSDVNISQDNTDYPTVIGITQSGSYVIADNDTTTCAAIRAGGNVNISGGKVTIESSAVCGKGISADGNVTIADGTVTENIKGNGAKGIKADGDFFLGAQDDATKSPVLTVATSGSSYTWSNSTASPGSNRPGMGGGMNPWGGGGWGGESDDSSAKAIKIMGNAYIYGGDLHVSTTSDGAEGLEAKKSVNINGGTQYIKCYDDCINSNGCIYFNGGTTVCYGYGNDAVDSNAGKKGAITIAGGNLFAYSTKGAPEEGIDCDNNSYIVITGGIAVSAGAQQGGGGGGWGSSSSSSSVGSSTQGYYLGGSPSSYSSSNYYTLYNTSGTAICTYKFEGTCSNSLGLLTASNLGKGTISVKYGTSKPTACSQSVSNAAGTEVFWINPTVTASSSAASVTAK